MEMIGNEITKYKCINDSCKYIFKENKAEVCVDKKGNYYFGCPKCLSKIVKVEK